MSIVAHHGQCVTVYFNSTADKLVEYELERFVLLPPLFRKLNSFQLFLLNLMILINFSITGESCPGIC